MAATQTPEVLWAQRSSSTDPEKNILYVHLAVPDVSPSSAKLSLTATSISFSGYSDTKKVDYKVDLELYDDIDVDNSKSHHSPRGVDLVLRKKEAKDEYWPRFLKETKKVHFLKTDFDKWVDEDEQDTLADDDYGNLGDMGGMGDMGGIDFSKLGAGMGGMAGMDAMADEGGDDEGSEDDMPALEEDIKDGDAKDTKPKIEEVA
ncbi:cell cycle regulator p21 protein [Histoplasma ohiense]|nr:cell cycle regulator p21 protein [Histoplasma ohiense (nom. inval.)]